MGSCCCSTRNTHAHLNTSPVYYYCPLAVERRGSSDNNVLDGRHVVDLDLDFSIPNTYRSPPTPLPYDVVLRCAQPKDFKTSICGCSLKTSPSPAVKVAGESGDRSRDSPLLGGPPRKQDLAKSKNYCPISVSEEEEVCPICLEEYDSKHPEIITKCKHHFHLACLLEWTERSDACPLCDKEMMFELTTISSLPS